MGSALSDARASLGGWFNLGRPENERPAFSFLHQRGLFILLSAALFFYIFPTYVQRPTQTSNNWATQILQLVYINDGTYNAFPSGHVYQTSLICLFYNRLYPNHPWFWAGIVVIVVLSYLPTIIISLTRLVGWQLPGWDTGLECIWFHKKHDCTVERYIEYE